MKSDGKKAGAMVQQLAKQLDAPPSSAMMTLAALMTEFFRAHADGGVDTGFGVSAADFWLTFDGREFFVTLKEK